MPIEATSCPLCGWVPSEVEARIEEMLDAAEEADVDLWALELCRRRVELDLAELERVEGPSCSRRRELEQAIELGVDVLATGFKRMELRVADRGKHGPC